MAEDQQNPAGEVEESVHPAVAGEGAAAGEGAQAGADPTATPEGPSAPGPETDPIGGPRAPVGTRPDPLASRGLRWGAATAVYVVVVVAILIAVNLVGSKLKQSWDLTAGHHLTLSADSRSIVADLKQPVQILAFEAPGDLNATQVQTLLHQYATASHGKITYQVVDPAADRALAIKYNVSQYGTVVVAAGQNTEQVQQGDMTTYTASGSAVFNGEQAITNAIIRAAAPVHLTVDFLSGDGEPDPTNGDLPDAYQALQGQGYTVASVNLLSSPAVSPTAVAAIIIVTPRTDLSTSEVNALKTYASAGGHIVALLDPMAKPLTNLDQLLSSWGVTPQNSLVLERTRHYQNDPTLIVPTLTQSAITAPLQQAHLGVLFGGAQGLDIAKTTPGYVVAPLLTSSPPPATGGAPESWAIRNWNGRTSAEYDPKTDTPGPITLAATVLQDTGGSSASSATNSAGTNQAASLGQKQFRAVIFGNSIFIQSNVPGLPMAPISVQGNRDLFLNAVGWATGLSQGVTVRPNPGVDTQVFLTGGSTRALMDTFLLGVPLVCFALAFSTWWSRRRL